MLAADDIRVLALLLLQVATRLKVSARQHSHTLIAPDCGSCSPQPAMDCASDRTRTRATVHAITPFQTPHRFNSAPARRYAPRPGLDTLAKRSLPVKQPGRLAHTADMRTRASRYAVRPPPLVELWHCAA